LTAADFAEGRCPQSALITTNAKNAAVSLGEKQAYKMVLLFGGKSLDNRATLCQLKK